MKLHRIRIKNIIVILNLLYLEITLILNFKMQEEELLIAGTM